jgi:multidrug efflux system membrane fusion protein
MRSKYLLTAAALLLVASGVLLSNLSSWYPEQVSATTETVPASPSNPLASTGGLTRELREGKFNKRKHLFNPDVVQVVAAPVRQTDFPIYLSGLGTVIAYNTVDVKAQIDGTIMRMNFVEGQDVKIGDPLVILDPTLYQARVDQYQGLKAKAVAQLENAKTNLWRDQELLARSFSTQKQTDAQQSLVDQYSATIAEYEAEIKYWQTQVEFTVIRSPINGRIGIRYVDPGNLIRAQQNTKIVTITQLQPISVIITVAAKQLAEAGISPGASNLPVLAFAQNGHTVLDRGTVLTVNNEVDVATGTIKLKAEFPNARYKLWPGDFAECRVVVDKGHDVLTVPVAAVRHGANGDFVWIVRPDNVAEHRRVTVKQTSGETAVIERGLQAADRVVIEGQYHLQPGSRVEVVSKDEGGEKAQDGEPEISSK